MKERVITVKEKGMEQTAARVTLNCIRNFEQSSVDENKKRFICYLQCIKKLNKMIYESKLLKQKAWKKLFQAKMNKMENEI